MDIVQLKNLEPIFGSWYVDREIGSGSFGKVYAIYKDDAGMRFWSALKIITIPLNDNEIQELDAQGFTYEAKIKYFDNIAAGITEEIRIMNTLRGYSNIVCFEDHLTLMHSDGIGRDILIRMELLQRLDDYMRKIRATQYDVVCMLRDIAQALVLCDKKNIIHRDIKPDNIMVSASGDYKLVDFGIARNMERASQASTKAGSYPYMAPEVQMHQHYGKSVDIYSLGIVAYRELNAYRYPFLPPYPQPFTAADRDNALYRRFSGEKLPMIPGVSRPLFSIIEKSAAFRPDHRYSSANELLSDLENVLKMPDLKRIEIYDAEGNLMPPGGISKKVTGNQASSTVIPNSSSKVDSSSASEKSPRTPPPAPVTKAEIVAKGKSKGRKIALISAVVLLAASAGLVFFGLRGHSTPLEYKKISLKSSLGEQGCITRNNNNQFTVFGDAEAGKEVKIQVKDGGLNFYDETFLAEDGSWKTGNIELNSLSGEGVLVVSATYSDKEEEGNTIRIQYDVGCTLNVTDDVSEDSESLSGTTDKNADITIYLNGNKQSTTSKAGGDGRFSVDLRKLSLLENDEIVVRATDEYSNLAEKKVTVSRGQFIPVTMEKPVQLVEAGSYYLNKAGASRAEIVLNGTARKNQSITIYANQQPVDQVQADSDGGWKYSFNVKNMEEGSTWVISADYTDPSRRADGRAATFAFTKDTACAAEIIKESAQAGSAKVRVKTEAGASVSLSVNDTKMTETADDQGIAVFSLSTVLQDEDHIQAKVTDRAQNKAEVAPYTVIAPGRYKIALSCQDLSDGDVRYVNGEKQSILLEGHKMDGQSLILTIDRLGKSIRIPSSWPNDWSKEIDISTWSDGEVTIQASYESDELAAYTEALSFVIDKNPPSYTIAADSLDLTPDAKSIFLTTEKNARVVLYINGDLYQSVDASEENVTFQLQQLAWTLQL